MRWYGFRWSAGVAASCLLAWAQTPPYYVVTTVAGAGKQAYPGDGYQATQIPLFETRRVTYDRAGNLYIAESYYCRVFKVSRDGALSLVAGNGECRYGGDGGPAVSASLSRPLSVAVDSLGNLYISDGGDSHRIRRVSGDGTITTIAGTGENGYSGDGGPATAAQISAAATVAIDRSDSIFFTDVNNYVVRKIGADGVITTVAGNGTRGFSGDGKPATSAQLNTPGGFAVDSSGNLYIADRDNQRIRKVGFDSIITTIAGNGQIGYGGDNGPALGAQFSSPTGIALDAAGNLYISDTSNGAVRRISGGTISTVVRTPCVDIAAGPDGDFAVPDNVNRVVHRLQTDGRMADIAGIGITTALGDNGPATSAVLVAPRSVAVTPQGELLITDASDNRIRRVNADGVITTVAGTGGSYNTGDNGPATAAQLLQPSGIAVDDQGNIFVTCNTYVRRIDTSGVIKAVAGNGTLGYSGDSGSATQARINFPEGLALDRKGNLYIADTSNQRVRRVALDGKISTVAGTGTPGYSGDDGPAALAQLNQPNAVATDAAGNLYISDSNNHRVRMVSPEGKITSLAGNGKPGQSGDGGKAVDAQLSSPGGVALDSAGNVFISSDLVIRRIDTSGVITTVAGSGDRLYSGDGDLATLAGMVPSRLAADAAGRVFVSDTVNLRIRRLEPVQIFRSGILHQATQRPTAAAPGLVMTIVGADLGPANPVVADPVALGRAPSSLGGTRVLFDGTPALLLEVSRTRAMLIAPYDLEGKTSVQVQAEIDGSLTNAVTLPVAVAAPGIYTATGSGSGQADALNEDGTANSPANPAQPGSVISFLIAGAGSTTPPGSDGSLAGDPAPGPAGAVAVKLGGVDAEVLEVAGIPGQPVGRMKVRVRIPAGVSSGPEVGIEIRIAGQPSQPGVTIAVQ